MPGITLVLDTSSAFGRVATVDAAGRVRAERLLDGLRGLSGVLPELLAAVTDGLPAPEAIGCVVGPGSFTGCRAGLAAAHGLSIGAGIPLAGVTVGEAFRAASGGRVLIATEAGEGRVFLDRDGTVEAFALDRLPADDGRWDVVAGDAAEAVQARLGLRGGGASITARAPDAASIAASARLRLAGALPPRAAVPLYVDPPRVSAAPGRDGARPPPSA